MSRYSVHTIPFRISSEQVELHDFAKKLGIPRRAFQGDHYDIPERLRDRAIELGAVPTESRELVKRLRKAGLRKKYKN